MIMFRQKNFNASSEASEVYVDTLKRGFPIGSIGILGMGFLLVEKLNKNECKKPIDNIPRVKFFEALREQRSSSV